jgi:transaldolase
MTISSKLRPPTNRNNAPETIERHRRFDMSDRLHRLGNEQGQSPWIDNLKRSFLPTGLAALVARGVKGVTSNPTIFQKAIAGSNDYDAQFGELVKGGASIEDAYWTMTVDDVSGACSVMRDVFVSTGGIDGYVSLEVSPNLADDTAGTIAAARHLVSRVNAPNLMVKIPATVAGVPAIEQMICEGADINVTLIFSLVRYEAVIEAYIRGLERRVESGVADLSDVASVASFFISRVDVEVDRRMENIGTPEALALRGKTAVAQGVLANHLANTRFSGPRWERLVAHGARPQRPLWASTGVKNPAYPDTLYVDTLIGPGTVNTLPDATLEAFADHGTVARTVDTVEAISAAHATWTGVAAVGIDMNDVATVLEQEGVAAFAKSFDELLATLQDRAAGLAG